MEKKSPSPTEKALEEAKVLKHQSRRDLSDVLGSYTGTDADGEAPEQDADDL
ncbi:MAG: hypothetical protein IJC52_01710 [Clostridia bacterium]|nr:hypothetical protein [Clostridia bacterium]